MLERWAKTESEFDEAKEMANHEEAVQNWQKKADEAKAAGEPEPSGRPRGFNNPLTGNQRPANLYHARLGPVMPYAIRGVIWYQGESNAGRAFQYREMFPLMISSWREAWKQGDFPFYLVQLADFMAEKPEPGDSAWAELREAQTMTQDKLPNTGQAVIIDIGEAADIHPRNKLEVAERLARLALANDYGKNWCAAEPAIRIDGKGGRQDRPEVQGRRRRSADGRQQQAGRICDCRRGPQMGVGRREARQARIGRSIAAKMCPIPSRCATPGPTTRCAICTTRPACR